MEYVKCEVRVVSYPSGPVTVQGQVNNPSHYSKMEVYASNPIDRMTNYSGSGLPFPCAAVAFDNTPNYHLIGPDGSFDVKFSYPNGYLTTDATAKVPPSVFVKLTLKTPAEPIQIRYGLEDPLPLRTLVNRPHHSLGPIYYSAREDAIPIAGAEATMLNLARAKVTYDIA